MVQNLKADIIYHQTQSDFEMEFNLCGCCRMRLLNDKTTDKKGFVKALARAVSRSRVIMACGPLFGTDGLINIVSIAIGSGLTVCDNATYGISGDETIQIIKGSTPLVTPDGYFGGCIIESGPQTIILLTENKAFRKTIMQNLIHPYVEEISYTPTKPVPSPISKPQPEVEPEVQLTEGEDYITDVDAQYSDTDFSEETPESDVLPTDEQSMDFVIEDEPSPEKTVDESQTVITNEHNIEFVMDKEESDTDTDAAVLQKEVVDSNFDNMYIEVEKPQQIKARYEKAYTPSVADNMFIATAEQDTAKQNAVGKHKGFGLDIALVILVLVLLLALLALVYFVFLKPYTMGISTEQYLKEIFSTASQNSSI